MKSILKHKKKRTVIYPFKEKNKVIYIRSRVNQAISRKELEIVNSKSDYHYWK